jgi:cytochrome P450
MSPQPLPPAEVELATCEMPGAQLHAWLAAALARGPVTPAVYAGAPAFLITGHAELAVAFRDNARFPPAEAYRRTIEPVQGVTFQTMEDEAHRLYRRLATPAFRSTAVARMETGGLSRLAHELLDTLPTGGCDLTARFSHRFPFQVISRMLGVPAEREEAFRGWASGFLDFTRHPAHARHCAQEITRYLRPILARRRREPEDDVISALLASDAEGHRLSDEEVLSHIRLLFTAGATTTVDALGNLLYALLSDRARWQLLEARPALRENAIEELLRWETPVAILPRVSGAETLHFAGQVIPPGSFCLFAIAAANRDPAVFEHPDTFDMRRDSSNKLLSFGPGPRLCPGMHLARKQLAVVLDVLLARLPDLRLADEAAARPAGSVLRGPRRLPVRY